MKNKERKWGEEREEAREIMKKLGRKNEKERIKEANFEF
jgi:hypothetical protein